MVARFMWKRFVVQIPGKVERPLQYLPVPPEDLIRRALRLEFRSRVPLSNKVKCPHRNRRRRFFISAEPFQTIDDSGFHAIESDYFEYNDDLESPAQRTIRESLDTKKLEWRFHYYADRVEETMALLQENQIQEFWQVKCNPGAVVVIAATAIANT